MGSTPGRAELAEQFTRLVQTMLAHGHNLHDPRYIGHQVAASVPLAGLLDAVGSVTNQAMAIYDMGPWATAAEWAMVDCLGQQIGWARGSFAGLATHGGSLANLTALLTARNVACRDSWKQGTPQGCAACLGGARRRPLQHRPGGRHPWRGNRPGAPRGARSRSAAWTSPVWMRRSVTCARSGGPCWRWWPAPARRRSGPSTPWTAWPTFAALRRVAARGCGSRRVGLLTARHRHLVAGLERADSVVWDAHKMLFMPALCAFVFYRQANHRFEAFRQDAPYLFDPAAPGLAEFDSGLRTIECTKRAAAFGLWGLWSLFGPQLFADLVDTTFALGQVFYEKLVAAADFQPLDVPQCNIVVFRHVPDALGEALPEVLGRFQFEVRRRLIESGEFYIVSTKLDGTGACA